MVAFETGWDSFEKKFWFSWDVWDKWDKNGKILFNLTKLHLTVPQSLLTQEKLGCAWGRLRLVGRFA